MPTTPPVVADRSGYIQTKGGILIPPGYNRAQTSSLAGVPYGPQRLLGPQYSTFASDGFAYGHRLQRDPDTLVIRWAPKGSGQDDLINQAIADGNIANAGIAPVLFAQLNGLMKRRQTLAYSTSIVVSGRTTRATGAIKQIIYQLDTYNRGAPIATVPILYPTAQWASENMTLIPIPASPGSDENPQLDADHHGSPLDADKYYLDVDWAARKTPIPYLPNPFDLEPTANSEWPYWFGSSAVWICLGFLGEYVLAIDERFEALIDTPDNGLLAIGGVTQTAQEIRSFELLIDKIESDRNGEQIAHDVLEFPIGQR